MSAAPVRVGIVGGGFIGQTVGEDFFLHPDAAVTAVADPDDEARTTVAERFDVPAEACYVAFEDLVESAPVDAVLIGTPHTLHYDQVLTALDADRHVLCDKPLATDLDRAREMVAAAEASERTVMVGYQRHVDPAFEAGRERWAGTTPNTLTAEITQNWVEPTTGTWRQDYGLSGGGFLYDTGSHLLDVLLWTTGLTPKSVTAEMTFVDDDRRIDSRARLLVDFENGATGTITATGDASIHEEHVHVRDDEGSVYFEALQWNPAELVEVDHQAGTYRPHVDRHDARTKAGAFVDSILDETEPPATVRDALRVTALTEAAYESARSGERVAVDLDG